MYLIDLQYFTGKYEITNLMESQSGDSDLVLQFIDIEVRSFMQNLLGLALFKEFDSYVKDGLLLPDAPEKWKNLVYGCEYDEKKWNGLTYDVATYQKSLLTNYIWCKYFVERNRIDGNLNANVIDSKNAVRGNPANKYYPLWNEMVNLISGSSNNGFVSLNQFIADKKEDYPTACEINVEYQNRFLLK